MDRSTRTDMARSTRSVDADQEYIPGLSDGQG